MRVGQLEVMKGNPAGALAAYREYLADFPTGRRWAEASFWAGKILLQQGDSVTAGPLLERVMSEDPFSYYAVEAAVLLGRSFPRHEEVDPVVQDAPWVGGGLSELDLLEGAGLGAAAALHVGALVRRADEEGAAAQYPLAEGLIERGWTIEGINRGWSLVRAGEGWNQRLLRILYPFPNRDMVEREAAEWGLDPLLMAGLIRQESAWDRDIVSSAGAVGLM
jgi:soluble lytic murein transglycosylase